ncbi:hypothetical protein [Streptomyces sp. NPDC001927]
MDLLPTVAAPGVIERAEALADAACELHDAAGTPACWSAAAVEDAVESMETTALALAAAHPDAAAATLAIGQQLAQLRESLGLPPGQQAASPDHGHQEQLVVPQASLRRPRARRGLGPGYQGLRIASSRTASGR